MVHVNSTSVEPVPKEVTDLALNISFSVSDIQSFDYLVQQEQLDITFSEDATEDDVAAVADAIGDEYHVQLEADKWVEAFPDLPRRVEVHL